MGKYCTKMMLKIFWHTSYILKTIPLAVLELSFYAVFKNKSCCFDKQIFSLTSLIWMWLIWVQNAGLEGNGSGELVFFLFFLFIANRQADG